MCRSSALAIALALATATAQAALVGRAPLTSGGTDYQAYYDTDLDITWVADANLAASKHFGLADNINSNGSMRWPVATAWILAMNEASYLGQHGWRLPEVSPLNGVSFNYSFSYDGSTDRGYNISAAGTDYAGSTANELAHLFYNTLDNRGYCDPVVSTPTSCAGPQPVWGLVNTGPFSNVQPWQYWFGTDYGANSLDAWNFLMNDGDQFNDPKAGRDYFAWAVHDGDPFSVVPIPSPVWLFASALGVMCWLRRKAVA